jgi:hypothetical protein
MQIKDMMIVFVVVGIVAYCCSGMVYLLNQEYNPGTTVNLSVIDSMNRSLSSSTNNASGLYNLVNGNQTITAGGVTGVIFNGIGNFFKAIFNIISMPFAWIIEGGNLLGIPEPIYTAIVTIILLALTFAIIGAILRRTP